MYISAHQRHQVPMNLQNAVCAHFICVASDHCALCHILFYYIYCIVLYSGTQINLRWCMRTRHWLQAAWSLLWHCTVSHAALVTTETPVGRTFYTSWCHLSTAEPSCTTASTPLPLNTFHGVSQAFPLCVLWLSWEKSQLRDWSDELWQMTQVWLLLKLFESIFGTWINTQDCFILVVILWCTAFKVISCRHACCACCAWSLVRCLLHRMHSQFQFSSVTEFMFHAVL